MKSLTQCSIAAIAAAVMVTPAATSSAQSVLFDFRTNGGAGVVGSDPSGSNFDPAVAGDFVAVTDADSGVTLTASIISVLAPEFDLSGPLPVATGNFIESTTNVSTQDALGINNLSIGNAGFSLIVGGAEGADLNPGESITFTFDQAVEFTSIELESVIATDEFDVLVDGVAVLETVGDDSFLDALGGLSGLVIAAGSEITFAADGLTGTDSSFRIETFEVNVVPDAVVPEPASLALMAIGGLAIGARRKRS